LLVARNESSVLPDRARDLQDLVGREVLLEIVPQGCGRLVSDSQGRIAGRRPFRAKPQSAAAAEKCIPSLLQVVRVPAGKLQPLCAFVVQSVDDALRLRHTAEEQRAGDEREKNRTDA